MPSKSKKQARLMAAVAHNPKFAKKVGIPVSVGREFNNADRGRRFDEGGEVLPSSTEDDEPWTDTYVKRPLGGLASMWGGIDPETGELVNPAWHNIKRMWNADERRREGLPAQKRASLGLLESAKALPGLAYTLGSIAKPELEEAKPDWIREAEEGEDAITTKSREALGLDAPHGFVENLTTSAGVMAGQLPIPGSQARKLKQLKEGAEVAKKSGMLKKIGGAGVEWFSPTIEPTVGNYVKGTLFGGLLGGGADYLGDYLDEKEQAAQQKEWIAEAMAEVLAEEQGEQGDEDDEAALAELGYAEGGRVGGARKAIGSLRAVLQQADPDDVSTRKAAIDGALHALKGTQMEPMDRAHLNTLSGGLSDAAADAVPDRRRRRFGDYESNVLRLLEDRISPSMVERPVPAEHPLRRSTDLPPPAPLPQPLPNDPQARLDRDLGPMRPEQVYNPSGGADNRHGALTQAEFDAMLQRIKPREGFATGGKAQNNPWGAYQAQKDLSAVDWEHYGEGPEHNFFGERRLPELKDWSPVRQSTPSVPSSDGGSSTFGNLAGLATLGLMGYDVYKDHFAGPGSVQIPNYPVDTTGTNTWIDQDLSNMEMPTAEFDPTVWERTQQGAGGAFDMYIGSQQGGIEGTGSMLSGAGDLYEAFRGQNQFSGAAGEVGGVFQGLGDGTVQGYLQAGGDATALAKRLGYSGPVFDKAGKILPIVGDLFSAYEGVKSGNPAGYAQAAGSLYSAASTAGLAPASGALASSGLGTAAPLAALGFAAAGLANQALGVGKKGAVLDAYLDALGGRRATVKEARNKPGGYKMGYYILPDGQVVSNQELKDMYVSAGSPFGDYV